MKFLLPLWLVCASVPAFAQLNTTLRANLDFGVGVNDVWGYVAPNGTEYAVVGLDTGIAVVDLADPDEPRLVGVTSGVRSVWRDMKTYGPYAYAVTDQPGTKEGLTVIDLQQLPDTFAVTYIKDTVPGTMIPFYRGHNLFIDTINGLLYTSGGDGNLNGGGMLIWDLNDDPAHPRVIAKGPAVYSHDVYVQDGIMYASEIYTGVLALYDVSDIQDIKALGQVTTPYLFTHNAWANADNSLVFTTDEKANASVAAYDISDPADIRLLDEYRPLSSLNTGTIPHNVHVINDYLSVSYYTDGLRVVDASVPENLVEVANYDTWSGQNGSYKGNWGAYPFLPSGLTLVSDRSTGLYVLEVDYMRAARLRGTVSDSISGSAINAASVEIITGQLNATATDAMGSYATGIATAGTYRVAVSAPGYRPDTISVSLMNGKSTELNVALLDTGYIATSITYPKDELVRARLFPNPTTSTATLAYELRHLDRADVRVYDVSGGLVYQRAIRQPAGTVDLGADLAPGLYAIQLIADGRPLATLRLVRQ